MVNRTIILPGWYIPNSISEPTVNTKYVANCPRVNNNGLLSEIFGWNTEIDIFEFIWKGTEKIEFSIHNWMSDRGPNDNPKKGGPCYSSQSKIIDFDIDFSKISYL